MRWLCAVIVLILGGPVLAVAADEYSRDCAIKEVFDDLDRTRITTGILYDRVIPLSHVTDYDGSQTSRPIRPKHWKQIYFEMYRASLETPAWPDLRTLLKQMERATAGGIVPVAFIDLEYTSIWSDALEDGSLTIEAGRLRDGPGDPYIENRVFAVTALKDYTHCGNSITFALDPAWYVTDSGILPDRLEMDFDDGLGFRSVELGANYRISYPAAGRKQVRVKAHAGDRTVLYAAFSFNVKTLQAPVPDDTLAVTATIPYNGGFGSGEAYLYYSDSHVVLTDPVIVVEGFDIDNNMNWEELHEYLNQEGMVESLRTEGYDVVALNFTDATDFIQRNSFVLVELIQQVNAMIDPGTDIAMVGASMGGLVGRCALAYMETNALDHNTRTFISFDSPQNGANIPLGLQYWVDFFSGDSEDAAYMLERLNTPAARQLLAYHLTDPPGTTGESDPLRTGLLADLAAVGNYPQIPRKVAVANGSGSRADQGFAAGDQVVFYEYYSLLVDIIGNVWAVPDSANQTVFRGVMDLIWPLPDRRMTVDVSGTRPYDNAPGGYRNSMAQLDSAAAPYGDIVALYDNHCFIPTISALALDTEDLFYDIAGDADLMTHTPFDTVYYPVVNEGHMEITAESATWFLTELRRDDAAVPGQHMPVPEAAVLYRNSPNPFSRTTTIRYSVARPERIHLDIYDIEGRRVVSLLDRSVSAGLGQVVWEGTDGHGRDVASGIYFCQLSTADACRMQRLVLLH
ncbi:MAG: T9SS type A sorting domain-containing protein [Candidatus Eisenbacteria bacterium]